MLCCIPTLFCSGLFYLAILPGIILFAARIIIRKRWGRVDITNEVDISGKTVIVTGASDGIGLITAEELAVRGAMVIMACRNLQKAEKAVREIRTRTTNGELIIMKLDLSSLSSVREFAAEFIQKYGDNGLSILVNNAGLMNSVGKRNLTSDGFEEIFGVNHLGHFLLTNLLLPQLEKAGSTSDTPSRIIIVSSGAHTWGKLNFDDLMFDKTPLEDFKWVSKLYCNSKLANNLFNLELAKRFRARQAAGEKFNVNTYALCPGFVQSNLGKAEFGENPPPFLIRNVVVPLLKFLILKDAREVAETTIYCSLSKYLTYHSGEMYSDCEFWDYNKRPKLSEKDAELLWRKSEELVNLK